MSAAGAELLSDAHALLVRHGDPVAFREGCPVCELRRVIERSPVPDITRSYRRALDRRRRAERDRL